MVRMDEINSAKAVYRALFRSYDRREEEERERSEYKVKRIRRILETDKGHF
jgi:hypothetical protein